ncbi:MAG: hypothetical protein Q7R63_00335 [bacterium]|nr:hypothetical protein [bacterium]
MTEVVASTSRVVVVTVVLLASLSFALGYLWGQSGSVVPIVIEKCSDA